MRNSALFLCIFSLAFSACSKKDNTNSKTTTTEVYVAGEDYNVVAIWNKEQQLLFEGTYGWAGHTYGVTVQDTNYYVAGSLDNRAAYWKNGESVNLTTGGSPVAWAKSIFFNGNDMYVAGALNDIDGNRAGYWKNGAFIPLLTVQIKSAECTDIAVVNNVVHALGTVDARVVYWKGTDTTVLSKEGYGEAKAMKVVGDDVYIVGYNVYNGSLWKNGVEIELEGESVFPVDVELSGSDVYVAGVAHEETTPFAAYWKNGKLTKLEEGHATGMTIVDGDVYISGYLRNGLSDFSAVYWKNGVKTIAGISSSGAGIPVKTAGIGVVKK